MINLGQVKAIARNVLEKNYWMCVGLLWLNSLVVGACCCIPYVGQLLALFIVPIVNVGYLNCYLKMVRGENVEVGDMFNGFKNYGHVLGGYLWESLWIFLWSLLCYIPGIIKSFSYAQTLFILMDEPEIEATEALEKSKQMMEGHKAELFILNLTFIGWTILAAFTCGLVGMFYVYPYMVLAKTVYYDWLKKQSGLFYTVENPVPVNPNNFGGADYNSNLAISTSETSETSETPAIPAVGSVYTAGSISELIDEEEETSVDPITALINEYDAIESESKVIEDTESKVEVESEAKVEEDAESEIQTEEDTTEQ